MKKFRIKNMEKIVDCRTILSGCVETVDGLEWAHINMDTGEITYSKGTCNDEKLRCALKDKGLEVEDAD